MIRLWEHISTDKTHFNPKSLSLWLMNTQYDALTAEVVAIWGIEF